MTETTTALYRKYRPQSFKEVRDQEHIVTVLKGAIDKGDIPHALLFCGGRGTGKTTLARIFAREIGTKEVDLYEIDAASNRGIDDIRALREAVYTLPYESSRKVYIIDEVHMLTKEAFNALLKTLEEPPDHVVFILATTEQDKVLDTIMSRCQVFTFRSPTRSVLLKTVTDIAKKEGITMERDAAELIAIAADGSFRDALSITQKVILASGDDVGSADEVAAIIGAPKGALLETLLAALNEGDPQTALTQIADAAEAHVDMKLFSLLLLERLRAVIMLRNIPDKGKDITEPFREDEAKQIQEIAKQKDSPINSHLLLRFLDAEAGMRTMRLPQLALELAVIEVCNKDK